MKSFCAPARLLRAQPNPARHARRSRRPFRTLRITELMYDAAGGNRFEYIEVQNTGTQTLNLRGAHLDGGVEFTFPNETLAAGEYAVIVDDLDSFRSRYGSSPRVLGEYDGTLDNISDPIRLIAGRAVLPGRAQLFVLDTWHPTTAGDRLFAGDRQPDGRTRARGATRPVGGPSNFENGSPGSDDSGIPAGSVVINEVLSHTDLANGDRIELFNTTATADQPVRVLLERRRGHPQQVSHSKRNDDRRRRLSGLQPGDAFRAGDKPHRLRAVGAGRRRLSDRPQRHFDQRFGRFRRGGARNLVRPARPGATARKTLRRWRTGTFGAANSAPKLGPVVINEVMYNPQGSLPTDVEYIELVNISAAPVSLFDPARPANTWQITSGIDFTFPTGITLPPGGFVVVVPFDPDGDPGLAADFLARAGHAAGVRLVGPFTGA